MKILIADDDPQIVEIIRKILHKENFSIDVAFDGQEAFQKAKKKKYEVILLDIMMPGKSGFDVITSLRIIGVDTPIIVISARSMVQDKIHAINSGADDYLVKSFAPEELIARVKSLMRRSAKKSTNFLHCKDIVMNLSDMSVRKGPQNIFLSRKEFMILQVLLKKKNIIVSRKEIMDAAWDKSEKQTSSNTLDVHMRFLRKKLDISENNKDLIKTFRGRGYMIQG